MITYDNDGRLLYIGDVSTLTDEKKASIDRVPHRRREETLNTQIEDLRRGR